MVLTDIVKPVEDFLKQNKMPLIEMHIYFKGYAERTDHKFDILTGHKALEEYARMENLKFDVERWVEGYMIPCAVTKLGDYNIRLFAYGG